MVDAISFDMIDEELQNRYNDLSREHTTDEWRKYILGKVRSVLQAHKGVTNVEFEPENVGQRFTESELISIALAIQAMEEDLLTYGDMSRLHHLRAAVFGK